jgi:hypothetical protein
MEDVQSRPHDERHCVYNDFVTAAGAGATGRLTQRQTMPFGPGSAARQATRGGATYCANL